MRKKNILHITTNNKFISHALLSFENVYPNQNTVWMFKKFSDGNFDKVKCNLSLEFKDTFKPAFLKKMKYYDLVILHSFDTLVYPMVAFSPAGVKFAWLGWGYDYYNYIYKNNSDLLLEHTLMIKKNSREYSFDPKKLLKMLMSKLLSLFLRKKAIGRISSISPVLKEDYDLIKSAGLLKPLPKYLPWNYGSLEDVLIKGFVGERVSGDSVLVGNSAHFTNNHVDVFHFLKEILEKQEIISDIVVPLSYGDQFYKEKVIEEGFNFFGTRFKGINDFMPLNDYVALIKKCGYVIMNHRRQQAVGNIVIMLYLGARVFLRKDNPTYQMLTKDGALVNTIEELTEKPELLKEPLTEDQIVNNIKVLRLHWSKSVIDEKTKKLVEFHLGE